jgi:hypothetical protein
MIDAPTELKEAQATLGVDIVHMNYQTNVHEIAGVELGERFAKKINTRVCMMV